MKVIFFVCLACILGNAALCFPNGAILTGLQAPVGMIYDRAGALYLAEWGADRVIRIQNGKKSVVIQGIPRPAGLALDDEGNLYIAGYGDGNIYVWKSGDRARIIASGLTSPTGLLRERDGSMLVANRDAGQIVRVFPDGRKLVVSQGHKNPVGISRTSGGHIFVSCYGGDLDLLLADGTFRHLPTTLERPGVGIIPAGPQSVFVVDYEAGKVARVDTSGRMEIIADNLESPVGLAQMPDDNILAGCWGDGSARIIRIK